MKNVYESWKTTILGSLFILAGFGLWLLPYAIELKQPVEWYYWAGSLAVGIVFVFSPDTVINALQKVISKKADEV